MPTHPYSRSAILAQKATSPEFVALFQKLAEHAEILAQMEDEFLDGIIRHREARTGKPFRDTKRQQAFLDECDSDANKASQDLERSIGQTDDKGLLALALSDERDSLEYDENMLPSWPIEDRKKAQRIIDFRRETIQIITRFIENYNSRAG
jgi:hypothetical protein